jgi:hypothetical protein
MERREGGGELAGEKTEKATQSESRTNAKKATYFKVRKLSRYFL